MTIQELAALVRKERSSWTFDETDLHVTIELQLENERRHKVTLSQFRHDNVAYARFTAAIGSADPLDFPRASSALSLNSHLAFGAVAVRHNELVLTETQPLGSVTANLAIQIISYLAHQADRYEAAMFHADER